MNLKKNTTWACDHLKTSNLPADNFKKYVTSMGQRLSPRYGQVILVSGYPVLTAVNWSQHWCPICVSVFLCSDPKLARKYETEHWSRSSKIINWSADSFQINHVTSMSWARDMVMGYWSVAILFWQLSIDHIVNVQCKRCGLGKTRLRHPSLPFDSLPYPTRTICRRVRTYVRSVNHVTTKRKEVDHITWVWGFVPRALRARGNPAIIIKSVSNIE